MPISLPEPDAEASAHSQRLAALIREEIVRAGGSLDFARYMELALYAPGLGYYSAGAAKFGADGDFITAPELGFVFARCLARAIAPTLRATGGDVLELGPGSGALAADLLLELERLDALPRRYHLLERSADLRERQHAKLLQRCPHLHKLAIWLDEPPCESWRGALIANEVVDALPVRLFALRDTGLFAREVATGDDHQFLWCERLADAKLHDEVSRAVGDLASLPRPYLSEACPSLAPWVCEVAGNLHRGLAVFVDYGYAQHEYYAPARQLGTLRCHYRHRAHNDPLILPGLQDITAWVDFDALAAAGKMAGFEVAGFSSQAQFLICNGLDEVFTLAYADAVDETTRYRLAQEVKRLSLPAEMGERFAVMMLSRPHSASCTGEKT